MGTTEFSQALLAQPALWICLLLGSGLATTPAEGQDVYRVTRTENFRQQPESRAVRLALVERGAVVASVGSRGQWLQLDLEGWIWSRSVGRIGNDDYDLRVTAQPTENLRDGPNGNVIARLSTGALLNEIDRQGNWVHVHRVAWMYGQSLERVATQSVAPPAAAAPAGDSGNSDPPAADTTGVRLDAAVLTSGSIITDFPGGAPRLSAETESPVRIVGRDGEWVRVQFEGWVREADVRPADDGVLVGVTGAEVRANPDIYVGQLVQWTIQYVSVQVANELRRDIPEGQAYILARGPVPEAGFVYALVSDEQRARVEALPQLSELVVIGRVRRGRSEQLGNPIIELVDFSLREE